MSAWFEIVEISNIYCFCLQFHHRDPGIVGLLTSYDIPKPMFYGLIADGIHTHPTATRIAHRSHPRGRCCTNGCFCFVFFPSQLLKWAPCFKYMKQINLTSERWHVHMALLPFLVKLEFGNVGLWGKGKTSGPGEKPLKPTYGIIDTSWFEHEPPLTTAPSLAFKCPSSNSCLPLLPWNTNAGYFKEEPCTSNPPPPPCHWLWFFFHLVVYVQKVNVVG